jgi:hypothetical protein
MAERTHEISRTQKQSGDLKPHKLLFSGRSSADSSRSSGRLSICRSLEAVRAKSLLEAVLQVRSDFSLGYLAARACPAAVVSIAIGIIAGILALPFPVPVISPGICAQQGT